MNVTASLAKPAPTTTYNGPACCRYCRDGDEFVRAWSIVNHLIDAHPEIVAEDYRGRAPMTDLSAGLIGRSPRGTQRQMADGGVSGFTDISEP